MTKRNLEKQIDDEESLLQQEFVSLGAMQEEDYTLTLYKCLKCKATVTYESRIGHYRFHHKPKEPPLDYCI